MTVDVIPSSQATIPCTVSPKARVRSAGRVIRPTQVIDNQISFLWQPKGSLVELVYDPDCEPGRGLSFIVSDEEGIHTCTTVSQFGYKPLRWIEDYARCNAIRLPSGAEPYGCTDELVYQVRDFIHRYFDVDPVFESVATLYVLHTWVYERFHAVPYLRFMGLSGTGKTRGTETIGALCYRSLAISGSTTSAAMFRMIEAVGGTVLIDEADFRDSSIGADIIKILNCGYQKSPPVIRMEKDEDGNFVPKLFQVFGPKIINGRQSFKDDATESRCLACSPVGTRRTDVPTQLPDCFEDEAREIRNQLLRWRLETLDALEVQSINNPDLNPRMNQIISPLLVIAELLCEGRYKEDLIEFARQVDGQIQEDRKSSVESKLVESYIELTKNVSALPTCKDLAVWVVNAESDNDPKIGQWLTPKKVGKIVRSMGFSKKHTRRGSEVSIDQDRLRVLCERFGIVTTVTESSQS